MKGMWRTPNTPPTKDEINVPMALSVFRDGILPLPPSSIYIYCVWGSVDNVHLYSAALTPYFEGEKCILVALSI